MIEMNHNDDVSFNSIMNDIFMSKDVKDKTKYIKVVVSVLGSKNIDKFDDKIKCLRKTFEKNNYYEYCGKIFVFLDDFENGDKYNDYHHYYYMYDSGSFRVDYKIIE